MNPNFFKGLPAPTQSIIVICATTVLLTMVFLAVNVPGATYAIGCLLAVLITKYRELVAKSVSNRDLPTTTTSRELPAKANQDE